MAVGGHILGLNEKFVQTQKMYLKVKENLKIECVKMFATTRILVEIVNQDNHLPERKGNK